MVLCRGEKSRFVEFSRLRMGVCVGPELHDNLKVDIF